VGQEFLVERTPVGADPHGFPVPRRTFDDRAELAILLVLEADIAGVDPVFVQRLGAGRMIGEKLMSDIVEVADERHRDADPVKPLADVRDGRSRLVPVDGDAHDLGAGARQCGDLGDSRIDVGRIRVGHRLDDDRRVAADHHRSDPHADRPVPRRGAGGLPGLRTFGALYECHARIPATAL
jgi:hypothetical protein